MHESPFMLLPERLESRFKNKTYIETTLQVFVYIFHANNINAFRGSSRFHEIKKIEKIKLDFDFHMHK